MKRENNPKVKGFPMFLLSLFLPGAAHMYMGLMKRGLQILLCFAVAAGIQISGVVSLDFILLPIILIIYVYSFFDGYSCLRRIRAGEHVEDEGVFEDFRNIDSNKINKHWIGIGLVLFGALILLDVFTRKNYFVFKVTQAADFMLDILPAVVLLVFGIVLITRNKNKSSESNDSLSDDITEITDDNDEV